MLVTLPDNTVVHAQGRIGLAHSERLRQPDFVVNLDARWEADPELTWPYRLIAWDYCLATRASASRRLLTSGSLI